MRLWEAILRGCEGTKQVKGVLGGLDNDKCCVMGAAMQAIQIPKLTHNIQLLMNCFGILKRRVDCPVCQCAPSAYWPFASRTLYSVCVCLNNNHGWTREAIAEFVRTIEDQAVLVEAVKDEALVGISEKHLLPTGGE